ncbi:MAG TPA: hypothetical protein VE993_03420 [Stellaceae bacterium]|nr:hypothetical protein [Stellaceae bacterium]
MPLPATVALAQRDTVRVIATARLEGSVLSPLAADPGALEDLAGLESVTDRLSDGERALLMGERLARGYGWSPSRG